MFFWPKEYLAWSIFTSDFSDKLINNLYFWDKKDLKYHAMAKVIGSNDRFKDGSILFLISYGDHEWIQYANCANEFWYTFLVRPTDIFGIKFQIMEISWSVEDIFKNFSFDMLHIKNIPQNTDRNELQNELLQKHSRLFKKWWLQESLMYFWFDGIGLWWYCILISVFENIEKELDKPENKDLFFEFVQIKEKFWTLRLYTHGWNKEIKDIVSWGQEVSSFICEKCGKEWKLRTDWWYFTFCNSCKKKHDKWEFRM